MTTYCTVEDILTGDVRLPAGLDKQKFVQDATDEIDSRIGLLYQTPIDVSDTSTVPRPVRLLLKRLAAHLATGRLILAQAAGGERSRVHAYGEMLIKEVCETLDKIQSGATPLLDVPLVDAGGNLGSLPLIANKDAESSVDAFYDRILMPDILGSVTYPYQTVNNRIVPW